MWKARQLQQEEFEEHMEAIKEHEKHLADFHNIAQDIEQERIPVPVP